MRLRGADAGGGEMEILNTAAMCERLQISRETFRGIWRQFPHIFAGTGRDLRSARFTWDENSLMEAANGNQEVSDKGGATISGRGISRRRSRGESRRIPVKAGGASMGKGIQNAADLKLEAQRFGII
jgi:hypothetical protein